MSESGAGLPNADRWTDGRTDRWTDRQTDSPRVLQDFVPFGSAAQKGHKHTGTCTQTDTHAHAHANVPPKRSTMRVPRWQGTHLSFGVTKLATSVQ